MLKYYKANFHGICFHETLLSRVYRILTMYCFLNEYDWNLFISLVSLHYHSDHINQTINKTK